MRLALFLFLAAFCLGCKTDYANLPAYSGTRQLQAVIETPAGSARRLHYDPEQRTFGPELVAGQERVLQFLPLPANFGFIPSTNGTKTTGFLKVVVLGESREPGTVMEVTPIGVLLLELAGELQYQVIAIPARPSEQLIPAADLATFSAKFPAAKRILELWFLNHEPAAQARLMGWKDERFADELVQKWMK